MAKLNKKPLRFPKPENLSTGLTKIVTNFIDLFLLYMTNVGLHCVHISKKALVASRGASAKALAFMAKKLKSYLCTFVCVLKAIFCRIFASPISFCNEVKEKHTEARATKGKIASFGSCSAFVCKRAFNNKNVLVGLFNYVAPVVAVVFLISLVTYASNVKYAIGVECNGQTIGFIDKEDVAEKAQVVLQERIQYVEGDQQVVIEPKLTVKKVDSNETLYTVDELADKMIQTTNVELEEAYGFYINGSFIGAVKEKKQIEETLNGFLEKFDTGSDTETVSFVDSFEFREGLFLEHGIKDDDEIIAMLNGKKQVEAYYTVVAGDAPSIIAQKVGLDYSELKALNPEIETTLLVGQQVLINREQPFVSVRVTRDEEYDVALPYNTVQFDDASRYKGTSAVIVNGIEGSAHVYAKVSYVDGYEDSRNIVTQTVTKEPVDKQVAIGTKSTGAPASVIQASGGNFMWPVMGGSSRVSSGFGWRWGAMHYGIDIWGGYGTPIYAAKDGVVIEASSGWNGGYGNVVRIDHGNGFVTTYAHNSSIQVSVGQYVSKGDLISNMGNTGQSYGTHCHFEVRQYGTAYNPINFLG